MGSGTWCEDDAAAADDRDGSEECAVGGGTVRVDSDDCTEGPIASIPAEVARSALVSGPVAFVWMGDEYCWANEGNGSEVVAALPDAAAVELAAARIGDMGNREGVEKKNEFDADAKAGD